MQFLHTIFTLLRIAIWFKLQLQIDSVSSNQVSEGLTELSEGLTEVSEDLIVSSPAKFSAISTSPNSVETRRSDVGNTPSPTSSTGVLGVTDGVRSTIHTRQRLGILTTSSTENTSNHGNEVTSTTTPTLAVHISTEHLKEETNTKTVTCYFKICLIITLVLSILLGTLIIAFVLYVKRKKRYHRKTELCNGVDQLSQLPVPDLRGISDNPKKNCLPDLEWSGSYDNVYSDIVEMDMDHGVTLEAVGPTKPVKPFRPRHEYVNITIETRPRGRS